MTGAGRIGALVRQLLELCALRQPYAGREGAVNTCACGCTPLVAVSGGSRRGSGAVKSPTVHRRCLGGGGGAKVWQSSACRVSVVFSVSIDATLVLRHCPVFTLFARLAVFGVLMIVERLSFLIIMERAAL